MTITTDKYINLFTDFGFKKIFGEEPNKDLLIAFLNELLPREVHIKTLSYLKNERLGHTEGERRAVYDLYCTNDQGDKFIVEIQRVKQEFFKDRSVYYFTFAIQEQAKKGREWQYELKGVYMIAILDFIFDETKPSKLDHRVQLMETQDKEVFYHKLHFIYLEIPKFHKQLHELENDYEKWLFAFRNLHRLNEMPKELRDDVFRRLFELAEIAKMDQKERLIYEESLKDYWDLRSSIKTSYKEGEDAGLKKGEEIGMKKGEEIGMKKGEEIGERKKSLEIAKTALKKGLDISVISELTGLSGEEIKSLKEE